MSRRDERCPRTLASRPSGADQSGRKICGRDTAPQWKRSRHPMTRLLRILGISTAATSIVVCIGVAFYLLSCSEFVGGLGLLFLTAIAAPTPSAQRVRGPLRTAVVCGGMLAAVALVFAPLLGRVSPQWIASSAGVACGAAVLLRRTRPRAWRRRLGFGLLYGCSAAWLVAGLYFWSPGLPMALPDWGIGVAVGLSALIAWRARPIGALLLFGLGVPLYLPSQAYVQLPYTLSGAAILAGAWLVLHDWLLDCVRSPWTPARLWKWLAHAVAASREFSLGAALLGLAGVALVLVLFPKSASTPYSAVSRMSFATDCGLAPQVSVAIVLSPGISDVDLGIGVDNVASMPSPCSSLIAFLPGVVVPHMARRQIPGQCFSLYPDFSLRSCYWNATELGIPLDAVEAVPCQRFAWVIWKAALSRPTLSQTRLVLPIASPSLQPPDARANASPLTLFLYVPADYVLQMCSAQPVQCRVAEGPEAESPWRGYYRLDFSLPAGQGDFVAVFSSEQMLRLERLLLAFLPFLLGVGATLLIRGIRAVSPSSSPGARMAPGKTAARARNSVRRSMRRR